MKNSHLKKSERNQQIRILLVSGKSQAEIAKEFNVTPPRLGQLGRERKWVRKRLWAAQSFGRRISALLIRKRLSVVGFGMRGRPVRYWNTPFVPHNAVNSILSSPRIIGYKRAQRRSVIVKWLLRSDRRSRSARNVRRRNCCKK